MSNVSAVKSLLKRMYFTTWQGKIALAAAIYATLIPFVHFIGGAPALTDLREIEGKVLEVQVLDGIKGSKTVVLETAMKGGGLENLEYYINRGDVAGEQLTRLIKGSVIRALVEGQGPGRITIYDLEVDGRKYVDYHTRDKQLSGNPRTLFLYFMVCIGVFVLLSIKRYSEERRR